MTDGAPLTYTMGELNQQTARVMGEITEAGKPAFITSYGRFVAAIIPLAPGQIEQQVLAKMAREIAETTSLRVTDTEADEGAQIHGR